MTFIEKLKQVYRKEQFKPTFLSLFINSNYLIRREIYNAIRRNAHYMEGKMLDFGCGTKAYASLFEVEEHIGVDLAVNEGHQNPLSKVDVFYNGTTLPFEASYFDAVYSSEVVEHIFNLPEILFELNRVLRVGGKLLFTFPFVWPEHEAPHDFARYTTYGAKHLFEQNGFRLIKLEKRLNFFQTMMQLWAAFFYYHLFPKSKLLKALLTPIFIAPINILARLLTPLMPKNNDLYGSNVFVLEKIKPAEKPSENTRQ